MSQLQKFISILTLTLKQNLFFFKITKTKFILRLVILLIRYNYFIGYKILSSDPSKLIIFLKLNFTRSQPYMMSCKQISKFSSPVYVKYHQLRNLNSSLLILSTSKGILTQKEAFYYQLGGIILCKIV